MDTLYTARLHGFANISRGSLEPVLSEQSILSLLIVLGSSISLVGLVFAFITYSLFSDLRNLSGTTLMNLLAALFMTQLLYVVGVGGVPDSELCIGLAFSLQYVRLCVICWLLAMTHHMYIQFRTNLHVLTTGTDKAIGRKFIRYSLFSWGLPAILLGAGIAIQYHDKAGKLMNTASLKEFNCWFLDRNAFLYGLLLPSCALLIAIVWFMIRAATVSRYVISLQMDKRTQDKIKRRRTLQIMLFAKIAVLLAIVMALAALCKFRRSETVWIAYHVGQGLQGILVAILVTCNCQVLKLYGHTIKSRKSIRIPSNEEGIFPKTTSLITRSTSLQLLTWEPDPDSV